MLWTAFSLSFRPLRGLVRELNSVVPVSVIPLLVGVNQKHSRSEGFIVRLWLFLATLDRAMIG